MTQAIELAISSFTPSARSRGALADVARARRELIESGEGGAIPAFDAPMPEARDARSPVNASGGDRGGSTQREGPRVASEGAGAAARGAARGESSEGGEALGGARREPRASDADGSAPVARASGQASGQAGGHAVGAVARATGAPAPDAQALLTRLGNIGAANAAGGAARAGGGVSNALGGAAGGALGVARGGARVVHGGATYQRTAQRHGAGMERDALIEQIQRGLAQALRQGQGDLTIRLRPEHLGLVRVRVSVVSEQVTATIGASSERARELLGSDLRTLREALEARGLSVDRIVVEHDEGAAAEREAPRERGAGDSGAPGRGRSPGGHDPGAERGGEALPTMRVEARSWDGRVDTLA